MIDKLLKVKERLISGTLYFGWNTISPNVRCYSAQSDPERLVIEILTHIPNTMTENSNAYFIYPDHIKCVEYFDVCTIQRVSKSKKEFEIKTNLSEGEFFQENTITDFLSLDYATYLVLLDVLSETKKHCWRIQWLTN